MQIFWYQDEFVTEVNKLRIVLETYKKDGNKIDLTNDDQFDRNPPPLGGGGCQQITLWKLKSRHKISI